MNIRFFRSLALGFGLAAIFTTGSLNATTYYSQRVEIPFEFRVGKHTYGAGTYRIEQDFGKEVAYLVNMKTGQRFQMMRPLNTRTPGSGTLEFELAYGVRTLKRIS
jgi:hypothetical protein